MYPTLHISTKNTPTFPLPQLPNTALKLVLLNFDSFQLLSYSLISNKCKHQVVSLQKRAYYINVLMTRNVNIFIGAPSGSLRLVFYMDHDQYWEIGEYGFKKILETPKYVGVNVCPPPDHKVFRWKNNAFGMADWLNHLFSVFHHQNLDSINFLEESTEFNIDDLKGAFGRANKLITRRTDCEVFSQLILQKFIPIPELSIQHDIFQDSDFKIPLWILIQNFEKIEIGEESEVRPQVDLDDLLVMNSKKIDISVDRLSLKIINKLGLSLTSRRCKQLAIDAENEADFLQVAIENSVTFIVKNSITEMWLAFSNTDDAPSVSGQKRSLRAPSSVTISTYYLENPVEVLMDPWVLPVGYDFEDWLDHILSVFHHPDTIDYVQFEQTSIPFDLKDIKEVFGKTDGLDVLHTGCYEYNQLILKEFLPVKHFSVDTEVFQDSSVPKNLLIQHFETFIFGFHNENLKPMKLDDLLVMNSKHIDIQGLEISPKEFNRFLKLWIKGALPQLEYFAIIFPDYRVEEDEVMKGINYQKFSSQRKFSRSGIEEYIIPDGLDFYGKDGLNASVQINYGDPDNCFELFVFHDHCIVTSEVRNQ
ncbi:unnamed protein product [Caenorhabditis brenneri]